MTTARAACPRCAPGNEALVREHRWHRPLRRPCGRGWGRQRRSSFGAETMLQRVVRLLSAVVSPIVVVAAAGQSLPDLPADVIVARDEDQGRGPLEGLRAGLKALPETVDRAYVTSCNVPLLVLDFVRRMIDLLADHDIAVVEIEGFPHPLSAVYRCATRCRMWRRCWRRIDCGRFFSSMRSEPAACSRRR